ncbi:Ubiquinone biosynthesis O-methyltransferase [Schistosoma japonicum]|nr:Ubiquinone biosynthesis O-methyltransferase [Schistosoma japonicum]
MEGQQHLMNYEQFIVTDQLNTTNDNTKHIDPCQPMFSQRVEENNNLARLNECLKQFDQSMNYIGNKFTQFGSLLNTYLTASTSKSSGCAESDLQTSFDALMKHFQTVFKQINHMRSQQFGTQSKPLNNDELSLVGDFESQLIACSRIASILYDRLSTDIFQHGELLNNLKECSDSFSVTLLTLSQFHSDPGVLEVYSSITSTYDHIKHIQSLLLSREQDASDTLKLTYAFQQKLEHITACKTETQNTLKNTKHNSVQTDFLTNNEQSNQQISNSKLNGFKNASEVKYETLLKYGLVNPRNVLNRTSKHSGCFESHKPTKSELQEALLNALCQLDRLKKYRLTQKTRIDQLQERLDHMGSELDSSVDTIRHHQTNYEAQKRRTAMEINHLRNQLAKTTVLLDQFKLFFSKANLNTTSLNQNIRGNDIMPSETSLAGEISLISEIIRYGDVGEPICLNESQLHSSHVSSKHAEVSLRKSDEATINDHRNSSTDFKSIYNVNGSQNVSEESFHSQLLHRLKGAEEEAIMAMDQLRASNAEFLTLKERLSHATVERAHLKATIEGLDEQVALLEDSLYERTQELHKYQMLLGEYCPTYQKQISPHSVISEVSLLNGIN